MTPQEKQMIDDLVQRIRTTQVQDKDDEADQYIKQTLAAVPDALYILTQTVLVQDYGLQQAQDQIADLQQQCGELQQQAQQAQQPKKSFLGSLLGTNDPTPQYQPVNNYGPPPSYPPPGYGAPPAYGQPMGYGAPAGGGGFLRGALQTAAGVAAGEMLFEGAESLFHGFGHEGGFPGGGESRPTEVINNNYYDGQPNEHHESSSTDGSFYNPGHDASSQNDFASSTQGNSYDDNNLADDSGNDLDTDDSSNFDDGGSSGGDDSGF